MVIVVGIVGADGYSWDCGRRYFASLPDRVKQHQLANFTGGLVGQNYRGREESKKAIHIDIYGPTRLHTFLIKE